MRIVDLFWIHPDRAAIIIKENLSSLWMRYGEGKLSCTVLKTNGIGDNLVEFNTKPNKPTGYI